jgi:hypothetical protein
VTSAPHFRTAYPRQGTGLNPPAAQYVKLIAAADMAEALELEAP